MYMLEIISVQFTCNIHITNDIVCEKKVWIWGKMLFYIYYQGMKILS